MIIDQVVSRLFNGAHHLDIQGTFQFVSPPDEALWVRVEDDVTITRGMTTDPDVVVRISRDGLQALMLGTTSIEQLYADGRLQLAGDIGLATRLPEIIRRATNAGSAAATQSEHHYPAPPRYSEVVSSAQILPKEVPRIPLDRLSFAEFRESYVVNGLPLVISHALDEWPLYRMTIAEAAERFAPFNGISRHGDYVTTPFSHKRMFRATQVGDFLRAIEQVVHGQSDEYPDYMANNALPEALHSIIRFPPLFPTDAYQGPRFWLGPAGTVTPLHRDATDNLFAQVWGTKSFILAAPHARPFVYAWSTTPEGGLDGCDADPVKPNLEKHPLMSRVAFTKVEVRAGELLFIPEGWFHHVRSETTSLSVNFWVRSKRA